MKGRRFGLGLGGNTPETPRCLGDALRALRDSSWASCLRVSPVYRTSPQDGVPGGMFWNCVVVGEWTGADGELLAAVRTIESSCGSPTRKRGASRNVDLDVLFLEGGRSTRAMILPHPRMHLRRFVLKPLSEVFTDPVPGLGLTPEALLAKTPDISDITLCEGVRL